MNLFKNKNRFFLLVLFSVISFYGFNQDKSRDNHVVLELRKYFKGIVTPEPEDQNHLFNFQYKYMYSPWGKTIGARGGMFNFGINLGRFFSNKIIIGPVADMKLYPGGARANKLTSEFLNDFNASFTLNNSTLLDSVNSLVYSSNFNKDGIRGNSMFNLGVMISLFPQKFGALMLQIKKGGTSFQFHNMIYGNTFVNGGGNDKVGMWVSNNWTYELIIKPFAFFRNTFYSKYHGGQYLSNSFVISFYYERLNFRSSEFNGTKLIEIVNDSFISKYGIDNRFGIKIGLAFY